MISDIADIIKGQDQRTTGEIIGTLAAAAFYGSGAAPVLGSGVALLFGEDGWEFVKGLASKLGGAIEDAWTSFRDWIDL